MTARSTRNKLKWQCVMIMKDLDKCQEHLKLLSDLSGGNSLYINDYMPNMVFMVDGLRSIIKTFREGL